MYNVHVPVTYYMYMYIIIYTQWRTCTCTVLGCIPIFNYAYTCISIYYCHEILNYMYIHVTTHQPHGLPLSLSLSLSPSLSLSLSPSLSLPLPLSLPLSLFLSLSLSDGVLLIDPEYFKKESKKDRKGLLLIVINEVTVTEWGGEDEGRMEFSLPLEMFACTMYVIKGYPLKVFKVLQ